MLDLLAVNIAIVCPLPDGAGSHIPPYPAPLCFGQYPAVPVGNHKVRDRLLLDGFQTLHQLRRDRPLCRLCLQVVRMIGLLCSTCQARQTVMCGASPSRKTLSHWRAGVKAKHDERIGRQAADCIQERGDLLFDEGLLLLRSFAPLGVQVPARRLIYDLVSTPI